MLNVLQRKKKSNDEDMFSDYRHETWQRMFGFCFGFLIRIRIRCIQMNIHHFKRIYINGKAKIKGPSPLHLWIC